MSPADSTKVVLSSSGSCEAAPQRRVLWSLKTMDEVRKILVLFIIAYIHNA